MPLYDFKCTKCETVEEREIGLKEYDQEKDKQTCQKCNSPMVRKIGQVGILPGCLRPGCLVTH